jgi:signal transduction histidine kinase/CheY-like chemotaxis protein
MEHARDDSQKETILRLNQCLVTVVALASLNTVFEFFNNLYISVTADLLFLTVILFNFWVNKKGYTKIAIRICYISVVALITAGNFMEGLNAGNYQIYIVMLFAVSLVMGLGSPVSEYILLISIATICAIASFIFFPWHSAIQTISLELEQQMFVANFLLTCLGSAVISFVIFAVRTSREKLLVDRNRFIDAVYHNSDKAIFIVKKDLATITDMNLVANALLGISNPNEVTELPAVLGSFYAGLVDFYKTPENAKAVWREEVSLGNSYNQSAIFAAVAKSFEYDDTIFYRVSLTDITALKKAQAEKELANQKAVKAAQAKSVFLSNISHELRTPLNGIIGTTNLMLQDPNKHYFDEQFNVLKHSSEHMLMLINDVLDFSKLDAGKTTVDNIGFNLKENLTQLLQSFVPLAHAKNIQLNIDCPENLHQYVMTDVTKLNQVINNLLANAIKFTHEGSVSFRAGTSKIQSDSMEVFFSVKDTGIGISRDKLGIIFESFTQSESDTSRKYGGTGLGLAISKKMVQLLGGDLQVKSEAGLGSEFYFTIKLQRIQQPKTYLNEQKVGELTSLKGLRILLAEDNAINMMIARKFLQKWDVEITEATDGAKALAEFERQPFDILLFDLEMPGIDGYAAIQKIRQSNSQIPAIAFTASLFENMRQHLQHKGFNDYIQKPFRPEDLHKVLARHAPDIIELRSQRFILP